MKRSFASAAMIGVAMEGQRGYARAEGFSAHDQSDRRSDRCMRTVDEPHGDRRADARPEAARGDDPNLRAVGGHDLGSVARRGPPVGPEADTNAARPVGKRAQNAVGAGEAAFGAAALLDRPGDRRLDRIDGLIELVTVKTEARFEPERVPSPEPDRGDARLRQQEARERLRAWGRDRDLVAVLPGVAGAGNEGLGVANARGPRSHEGHGLEPLADRETRKGCRRKRPLQRDERGVFEPRQTD